MRGAFGGISFGGCLAENTEFASFGFSTAGPINKDLILGPRDVVYKVMCCICSACGRVRARSKQINMCRAGTPSPQDTERSPCPAKQSRTRRQPDPQMRAHRQSGNREIAARAIDHW